LRVPAQDALEDFLKKTKNYLQFTNCTEADEKQFEDMPLIPTDTTVIETFQVLKQLIAHNQTKIYKNRLK
jgi:hypothetical protein